MLGFVVLVMPLLCVRFLCRKTVRLSELDLAWIPADGQNVCGICEWGLS